VEGPSKADDWPAYEVQRRQSAPVVSFCTSHRAPFVSLSLRVLWTSDSSFATLGHEVNGHCLLPVNDRTEQVKLRADIVMVVI
jgi:hypothetical protein